MTNTLACWENGVSLDQTKEHEGVVIPKVSLLPYLLGDVNASSIYFEFGDFLNIPV